MTSAYLRFMVLFQWFLMALSVRPGSSLAMVAHLLPCCACAFRMRRSSSSVKVSLRTSGFSWLHQLRGASGAAGGRQRGRGGASGASERRIAQNTGLRGSGPTTTACRPRRRGALRQRAAGASPARGRALQQPQPRRARAPEAAGFGAPAVYLRRDSAPRPRAVLLHQRPQQRILLRWRRPGRARVSRVRRGGRRSTISTKLCQKGSTRCGEGPAPPGRPRRTHAHLRRPHGLVARHRGGAIRRQGARGRGRATGLANAAAAAQRARGRRAPAADGGVQGERRSSWREAWRCSGRLEDGCEGLLPKKRSVTRLARRWPQKHADASCRMSFDTKTCAPERLVFPTTASCRLSCCAAGLWRRKNGASAPALAVALSPQHGSRTTKGLASGATKNPAEKCWLRCAAAAQRARTPLAKMHAPALQLPASSAGCFRARRRTRAQPSAAYRQPAVGQAGLPRRSALAVGALSGATLAGAAVFGLAAAGLARAAISDTGLVTRRGMAKFIRVRLLSCRACAPQRFVTLRCSPLLRRVSPERRGGLHRRL
jgi:hypothetical protein